MTIRTEDKNLDLKAVVTGYALTQPGISTAEICRKVRGLNIPGTPSNRTIYRMVNRLASNFF